MVSFDHEYHATGLEGRSTCRCPGGGKRRPEYAVGQGFLAPLACIFALALIVPCVSASSAGGMFPASLASRNFAVQWLQPDAVQERVKHLAGAVWDKFEMHRRKAFQRWDNRQQTLINIAKDIVEIAEPAGEESEVVAIPPPEIREQESQYTGCTEDQLYHMRTHYQTIRPSPTLLKEPEPEHELPQESVIEEPATEPVRSLADDEDAHVFSPTHEDEMHVAKRREFFRLARRLRAHRVLKSHTH